MSTGEVRVPLPGEAGGGSDRLYGATVNPGGEGAPPPAYADKPPPTYQEVTDVNAPPPSYDSLYGEFRQVSSPTGFAYFIRKLVGIIIGTGSVWVYRVYLPEFSNSGSPLYCDKLTYYFTFTLITITYVMMGLFLWLMCCCGCLALCCGRSAANQAG